MISGNSSSGYLAGGLNSFGGSATVVIDSASFLGNHGYNGGAIANVAGSEMTISASSFTENTATMGGGVHNSMGDLELDDCSFSSDYAASIGGGWSNHNLGGTVTLSGVGYANNDSGSGNFPDCYDVNGGCSQ